MNSRRLFICFVILLGTLSSLAQSDPEPAKEMHFECAKVTCTAYLLEPDTPGRHPAVLYLHWLGSPNGDKREFLSEAQQLRSQGAVSLLLDMDWAQPKWFGSRE